MKQKEALEAELKALSQVLESQGCGMEDPLVDGEGFPRADIDVYQVGDWQRHFIPVSMFFVFWWTGKIILTFARFDMHGMTSEAKGTT